ncbi:outer membrane beta-barrel domain-containing protein [Myxococcota bacterium]|nr:outer membrane beta-barrel domain-containing protein [Myxococcota bacterium]MBU1382171.1 outer membrane beta-barrel domain-containing protein [Myxococcota bacterium]MBU1498739.1 outer membrane beta-barrel domain-containing protein [Myxococcota bacterium]
MKTWLTTFLTIFVLALLPQNVSSQAKKKVDKKETKKDTKKVAEDDIQIEDDSKGTSKKKEGDDIKIEDDAPPTTGKVDTPAKGGDGLDDDLSGLDEKPKTAPKTGPVDPKSVKSGPMKSSSGDSDERSYWNDIKVVPRKLILKQNRVELIPYVGVTINDNLIRHILLGGEAAYYISDALSFSLGGHAYLKQQTDRAYLTGLQQRTLPTLNAYLWTATLNANYEAAYGKMAIHNKKILQWGIFLSGGLGATQTEIIPRNAGHESWTNTNITIQVGVGFRVFISKWLTVWLSMRNYMMQDRFESSDRIEASASEAEKAASGRFINNIVFQVGLSVFFPTDFEYTTFK